MTTTKGDGMDGMDGMTFADALDAMRVAGWVRKGNSALTYVELGGRVAGILRADRSFCGGRDGDDSRCADFPFCDAHAGYWN
jgi:hypothetical protein